MSAVITTCPQCGEELRIDDHCIEQECGCVLTEEDHVTLYNTEAETTCNRDDT